MIHTYMSLMMVDKKMKYDARWFDNRKFEQKHYDQIRN